MPTALTPKHAVRDVLILLVVCYLAFWWRLGLIGLIDPDEPFYSQTVHEMVETGDWITPKIYGQPQFEKPILYYWMVAVSYKIFGETEFAGRVPAALPATLAVLLVYAFGCRVFNRRTAFLSGLILATGLEYCIMARLMLTDIALALFFAGSMFSLWLALRGESRRNLWVFAHLAFGGLAFLIKGPIGTLVPLMGGFLFARLTRRKLPYSGPGFWWGVAFYLAINVPWYSAMFAWYPRQFWDDFFWRDNILRLFRAEHPANNHFYYYIGILLLGSIPWMPVAAVATWRLFRGALRDERLLFLWCWVLTSFLFLTLAQSKIPSYIFYLFVPLAVLGGTALEDIIARGFSGVGERRVAITFAVIQFAGALVAPLIKAAKPFTVPALLVAACLGVALLLLCLRRLNAWVVVTAMATVALLASALTLDMANVEALSSAKPIAARMLELRKGDEPLFSSKFLVRGVYYYTHQPVTVLAGNPQPFWAAHPLPVVVWKKRGLQKFLSAPNGPRTALCAVRKGDWKLISQQPVFAGSDVFEQMGDNIIVRARAVDPSEIGERRPETGEGKAEKEIGGQRKGAVNGES